LSTHEPGVFLSTLPAARRERRLALAVVLVSGAIFLALAPFAKRPLVQVWAFIPVYESALVIVFVAGDILNHEKRAFLERTGAPHVLKPFDLPEVRQLVHRIPIEPGADPRPEGSPGLR